MKIVYVSKEEFNEIVQHHFNLFKNFNNINTNVFEMCAYNKLLILFTQDKDNYILWDFIADETEADCKEHFHKFMNIKDNYLIGGYFNRYNNTMYCTDVNFTVIGMTNDIYENDFMDYLLERCNNK